MGAQLGEVKRDKQKRRHWLYFFAAAIGLIVILGKDNSPAPASHNGIGDIVTVHGDGWIACGSTKAALDEIINWQVRHDGDEAKRTMMATRSLPLFPGTKVKILDDDGFIVREQKVRVLADTVQGATVGEVCWVDSEMLK